MKKIILFFLLLLSANFTAIAQEKQNNEPESKSNSVAFLAKDGTLIQKDFYQIAAIKGVGCEVLIIKDLISNKKIGCLRLKTTYYSSYSTTYIGTLDADEIDACVQSLQYIKEKLIPSTPETYTEVEYKTRDGVKIGAYCEGGQNKWTVYVQTKSYTNRSEEFLDSSNIDKLINAMITAKQTITAKLQ